MIFVAGREAALTDPPTDNRPPTGIQLVRSMLRIIGLFQVQGTNLELLHLGRKNVWEGFAVIAG